MTVFWYVILMTALAYLTLILPMGLFFSEDDDDTKSIVSNLIYTLSDASNF